MFSQSGYKKYPLSIFNITKNEFGIIYGAYLKLTTDTYNVILGSKFNLL